MKRHRHLFIFLLISLILLTLTGCINLVQEVSIEEDGSGTLQFRLGVESGSAEVFEERLPEALKLENILSTLIQDDNILSVTTDEYQADERIWRSISLEVGDVYELFREPRQIGPVRIELDVDDEVYTFMETIDLAGTNFSIPGIQLLDLTGAGYTVRLSTPQILSTNGKQVEAGISTWEVPLSELLQGGESIFLQADYNLTPYEGVFIPWGVFFPYIVGGFLGLGILSILVIVVVNTRRKTKNPDKINFDM